MSYNLRRILFLMILSYCNSSIFTGYIIDSNQHRMKLKDPLKITISTQRVTKKLKAPLNFNESFIVANEYSIPETQDDTLFQNDMGFVLKKSDTITGLQVLDSNRQSGSYYSCERNLTTPYSNLEYAQYLKGTFSNDSYYYTELNFEVAGNPYNHYALSTNSYVPIKGLKSPFKLTLGMIYENKPNEWTSSQIQLSDCLAIRTNTATSIPSNLPIWDWPSNRAVTSLSITDSSGTTATFTSEALTVLNSLISSLNDKEYLKVFFNQNTVLNNNYIYLEFQLSNAQQITSVGNVFINGNTNTPLILNSESYPIVAYLNKGFSNPIFPTTSLVIASPTSQNIPANSIVFHPESFKITSFKIEDKIGNIGILDASATSKLNTLFSQILNTENYIQVSFNPLEQGTSVDFSIINSQQVAQVTNALELFNAVFNASSPQVANALELFNAVYNLSAH